jgi:predicted transposase/invertase (TIGR01784 family)
MTTGDYQRGLLYAEEKGETRGRTEGITIGSLRRAQEIARSLLAQEIPLSIIMNATGLSEPEILSLED